MTDVATANDTATEVATEAGEANGSGPKKTSAPIQLTVPLDLKDRIETAAKEANVSSARYILENFVTYKFPDYTLPEPQRAAGPKQTALFPKSLSPEQKKERFEAARLLLAALDADKLDLAAIKQQLGV